ncbi:MAG: esterase/lipase family protein [Woeseiaceae bacterium]
MRTALLTWLACMLLSACVGPQKPDLQRLYASSRSAVDQPPVILIPGLMGSRIRDAWGAELWPGSIARLLFSDFDRLALDIDPQTLEVASRGEYASGITDMIAGRAFYASIIRTLEDVGGYRVTTPGTPVMPGSRTLYVLTYDWRLDNIEAARALDRLIEQVRVDHGKPDLQVDIVAHSMGGLIARYYLRYGGSDVLDSNDFTLNYRGEGRVRRVALLGTPNLGSVESLHSFIEGRKLGFGVASTEHLATYASLFELFPHPINEWIIADTGVALDRDVFDIELWRRFQWSIFDPRARARVMRRFANPSAGAAYLQTLERFFEKHLERARRFVWSLTVPLEHAPWSLMVFGGDCSLTPARILVEEVAGESVVRLWPGQIARPRPGIDYDRRMLEPGDGTVTKASLLARESLDPSVPRHRYSFFPARGAMFLCEKHNALSNNLSFQDNLMQFLLSRDQDTF